MRLRSMGLFALALLFTATTAQAWSSKQHIMITRLAAIQLLNRQDVPEDLKQWIRSHMPETLTMEAVQEFYFNEKQDAQPVGVQGLSYQAVMPDLVAMQSKDPVEGYGQPERVLHYIDLEMFAAGDLAGKYKDDLSARPTLADIPHDLKDPRWAKAGMLPFRLTESYQNLVKAFALVTPDDDVEGAMALAPASPSSPGADLMTPIPTTGATSQPATTQPADLAMHWAGYLAHYAADNTQPQHATIDYRSGSYFTAVADGVRVPNAHWQVEWASDNDPAYLPVRQDVWTALTGELDHPTEPMPALDDPWTASLEVSLYSYDALPMIGRNAVAHWNRDLPPIDKNEVGAIDPIAFGSSLGEFHGQNMTLSQMRGRQMALATRLVGEYWLKAWKEAHPQPAARAGSSQS